MKINVISNKLIKPSTPTPQSLNPYKISFTDEFCPPMNVRILLFYPSGSIHIPNLELSLPQILPRFYPLAGRFIKEEHLVDCSDQGAEFIEAKAAAVESMDLVRTMESHHLNRLLPRHFYELDESAATPLLSVQATHFNCGGTAIGISVSHRIFDGSSLETFVLAWSEHCGGGAAAAAIAPSFDSPSLFPRGDLDCTSAMDKSEIWNLAICAKRFLFTNDAIARLRSELRRGEGGGEESSDRITSRVRVLCAVISKALIGVDRTRTGRSRPCLVVQAFNMRKRTEPALPNHSCGNLVLQSVTRTMSSVEAENISVGELVGVLGDALARTTSDCSRILTAGADGLNEMVVGPVVTAFEKSASGKANAVWFADWSKFGFCRTDFGWGKPVWASIGPVAGDFMTVLMEGEEGGGIEAWVHLKADDMACFEEEEGIRLFAKLM